MNDLAEGYTPLFQPGDVITNHSRYTAHPEQFEIIGYLGKGGFAECFAAKSLQHSDKIAIKVVDKSKLKDGSYEKMQREIRLHLRAHHKNIVRLYCAFECGRFHYLLLELCKERSLLAVINRTHALVGFMSEDLCRFYLRGILAAVQYLLDQQILHRDIKPGNIFIDMNNEPKLGDFGLAIEKRDLNKLSVSGTPNYLAPEVLMKRGHSEMSEVWSVGCLLYCMLTGKPPFETDSVENTYKRILKADFIFPRFPVLSNGAQKVIRKCLQLDVSRRPHISDLISSQWLSSYDSRDLYLLDRPVERYPLMRAKSVGDMLRDTNDNVTPRYGRPKSTAAHVQSENVTVNDKSRRKSIGGSHDSGFGSEVDMSRRPALSERVNRIIADLFSVAAGSTVLVPSELPELFISKWVDYTNKRGFACKLSDGTLSVKFNEGTCISIPEHSPDYFLHASTPFSVPKEVSLHRLGDVEREQIQTAQQYGDYMESELAGLEVAGVSRMTTCLIDRPYIVFHHLSPLHLIVVLSNGTVQINLLKSRSKVVVWKDDSKMGCPCGVAIFARDEEPIACRIVPAYETPRRYPESARFGDLSEIAAILHTHCDFLNMGRKPTLSTEC